MYTQRLHLEDLQSTGGKFDGPAVSEDRERLWRERERLTSWHAAPVPEPIHANAQERN